MVVVNRRTAGANPDAARPEFRQLRDMIDGTTRLWRAGVDPLELSGQVEETGT